MKLNRKTAMIAGAAAFAVAVGFASAAYAQQGQQTPKGWNYEIRDGKRVPKAGNRGDEPGRQLARRGSPRQLRDRQGTVGDRRV